MTGPRPFLSSSRNHQEIWCFRRPAAGPLRARASRSPRTRSVPGCGWRRHSPRPGRRAATPGPRVRRTACTSGTAKPAGRSRPRGRPSPSSPIACSQRRTFSNPFAAGDAMRQQAVDLVELVRSLRARWAPETGLASSVFVATASAHPSLEERLSLLPDARVLYRLRRPWPTPTGISQLVLDPIKSRDRARLPPPSSVVPNFDLTASRGPVEPSSSDPSFRPQPPRTAWARLLRRVLDVDALACACCGAPMVTSAENQA
jgi:hypothetical protein